MKVIQIDNSCNRAKYMYVINGSIKVKLGHFVIVPTFCNDTRHFIRSNKQEQWPLDDLEQH